MDHIIKREKSINSIEERWIITRVITKTEEMLFKESTAGHYEQEVDEVWYIPQQDEVNRGYYEVMHRAKPIMVPFVWHHKYIAESTKTITSGYQNGSYKICLN